MGACPTSMRRAVRFNAVEKARRTLEAAGTDAARLVDSDYAADCILQSCNRSTGNVFYYAVSLDRVEILEMMIEAGADVHALGMYDETCVHCAVRHNYVTCAKLLLRHGCDVTTTDDYGRLPIHSATMSYFNTREAITFLLKEAGKQDDVNARDYRGRAPLHEAAYFGNTAAIDTLLEFGADINAQTKEGNTPLHVCRRDGPATYDHLVEKGADPKLANNRRHLPARPSEQLT